jgi:hypothetical protein
MPTYRILYTAEEYREITIEAASESAARQAFIDEADGWSVGNGVSVLDDAGICHLVSVDET